MAATGLFAHLIAVSFKQQDKPLLPFVLWTDFASFFFPFCKSVKQVLIGKVDREDTYILVYTLILTYSCSRSAYKSCNQIEQYLKAKILNEHQCLLFTDWLFLLTVFCAFLFLQTVEKFFSKEIRYLVSSKPEARHVQRLVQDSPVPSPDSGLSSPHPGSRRDSHSHRGSSQGPADTVRSFI